MKKTSGFGDILYRIQRTVVSNSFLFYLVVIINLIGVVYGFFWYRTQLSMTPVYFWIFTPDCPGAALLFVIWILLVARKKPHEIFKVIAITALIKYGIWTVSVIGLLWIEHGIHYWENVLLFVSHIGMMVEGVVFAVRMKISRHALWITSLWLVLNDFVDYYFKVHPWLPDSQRLPEIRVGTFILSGLVIVWMVWINLRTRDTKVCEDTGI